MNIVTKMNVGHAEVLGLQNGSLPWHMLLRGLALTIPANPAPPSSWMYRARLNKPAFAERIFRD